MNAVDVIVYSSDEESLIDLRGVRNRLTALGMSQSQTAEVLTALPDRARAVLVYGSWARGEADEFSDIDLLVFSDVALQLHTSDSVSINVYSTPQMASLDKTLFGLHLARDAQILQDDRGYVRDVLAGLSSPDPSTLLKRIVKYSSILDATDQDVESYIDGLTQVGRYLLRTALYAVALRDGRPCFSLKEISRRYGDPKLEVVLSSHVQIYPHPSKDVLDDLIERLERHVGALEQNKYGSLRALIVGSWSDNPDLSHLATLALGGSSLRYSEIPKVVL